jgi:hypothetical protein
MLSIHYAVQTCDIASNQGKERYCGVSKTELSKKCLTSFFNSLEYVVEHALEDCKHVVAIIDDHSTDENISFLNSIVNYYKDHKFIDVCLIRLESCGIMNSIRSCYEWLRDNGKNLVYQVQDDYLFEPSAIYEMIDIYTQILVETKTECVVQSFNPVHWWLTEYRNKPTPRAVFVGYKRYWIQAYDTGCTFMTSLTQLKNNWNLIEIFLSLDPTKSPLENISLNYMFTKKGVLGVVPITSVGLHMQDELEKDPYIDWKKLWDSVDETKTY